MSFSIQTNVNALTAQENLRVNSNFQSRTIQRLTSGYRINSSGDDAAGLAVANKFRADTAELTQGVRNANDGLAQLQIVDGGVSNIGKMLDRMKTLATQSASATFTGDRGVLQSEYSKLISEIDREAANIGLGGAASTDAGRFVKQLGVYIGGASSTQSNASVNVDLTSGRVDTTTLGVNATKISGTLPSTTVGAVNLDGGSGIWLQNSSQDFEIATAGVDKKFTISGGADGMTKTQFLEALNTQLAGSGVSASTTAGGVLQLSSESGFVFDAKVKSGTGNQAVTTATTQKSTVVFDAGAVTDYDPDTTGGGGDDRVLTITVNGTALATTIAFNSAAVTKDTIFDQFRAATAGSGLEVIRMGDHMYLQSNLAFDVTTAFTDDGPTSSAGGVASLMANGAHAGAGTAPSSSDIGAAAKDALTKIGLAMSSLGTIQGTVGAGQNMLNYAISLAQSQISNFSSAESGIRDADVAAEAANLTKAQVLQQASMAAMAQANSAPQAVLALLRG